MKAILVAVFVVATFVASFVAAYLNVDHVQAGFLARFFGFALHAGWVAGVVVTFLFWLLNRKADWSGKGKIQDAPKA
jgi:hypothetical protein